MPFAFFSSSPMFKKPVSEMMTSTAKVLKPGSRVRSTPQNAGQIGLTLQASDELWLNVLSERRFAQ